MFNWERNIFILHSYWDTNSTFFQRMSLITVGLRLGGLKRLACCHLSLDLGLDGPPKTTNNSTLRQLHTCRVLACIKSPAPDEDKEKSAVITRGYFDRGKEEQNKENFEGAIDIFTHKDSRRRGSVEFIYAAMRNMEHFGVHRWYQLLKKLPLF